MNYNQFIQRQKELNGIPVFKNTEDAERFGQFHKGNQGMIQLLREERQILLEKVKDLMNEGKDSEALHLASGQSQFVREALQKAI